MNTTNILLKDAVDLTSEIKQTVEAFDEVLKDDGLLKEGETILNRTKIRNIMIRFLFRRLREQGMSSKKTLNYLSSISHLGEYLAPETIRNIVY